MRNRADAVSILQDTHKVTNTSGVPAPAWPESPGFGLALGGSGFVNSQARPKAKRLAWPGLALAWAGAYFVTRENVREDRKERQKLEMAEKRDELLLPTTLVAVF